MDNENTAITEDLVIETLGGGAALEKMNIELQRVITNLMDINKKQDCVREAVLKIKFKPNKERTHAGIEIESSAKLAPFNSFSSHAFLQRNIGGDATAIEVQLNQSLFPEKVKPFKKEG